MFLWKISRNHTYWDHRWPACYKIHRLEPESQNLTCSEIWSFSSRNSHNHSHVHQVNKIQTSSLMVPVVWNAPCEVRSEGSCWPCGERSGNRHLQVSSASAMVLLCDCPSHSRWILCPCASAWSSLCPASLITVAHALKGPTATIWFLNENSQLHPVEILISQCPKSPGEVCSLLQAGIWPQNYNLV